MEMINLLPPNDRHQLAASRTNSLILRYIFLLSIIIGLMTLEMFGVYLILSADNERNKEMINDNQTKASSYAATQAEAATFRSDLATAKYILDKQVPYTSLVLAIAQALPPGASLNNLALDPATFGTPTTLAVNTDSPKTAILTKTSLQEAKLGQIYIFNDVNFQSLAQASTGGSTGAYTATFGLTYSKGLLTR